MKNILNSPIKWVGGKRLLRSKIIPLIPKGSCYVEVFGGAGWVLFGKDPKLHKCEVYNDINGEVVNFFRVLKQDYESFIKNFEYLLSSREIFDLLKYQDPSGLNDVQKAFRFWYLLKYAYGGRKNQLSDYNFGYGNNRKPSLPIKQKELIDKCYERLQGVYVENLDYKILIQKYDGQDTIFYLDPPYLVEGKCYGQDDFTEEQHSELAIVLNNIKGRFILTVNDHEFFRGLYVRFTKTLEGVNYSSGNANKAQGKRGELIIRNFN